MSEIPVYMIWLVIVGLAFLLGVGVGCYLLQGPKTWRPREIRKLRRDNERMRLKLAEVERWADRQKTLAPVHQGDGLPRCRVCG